MNFWNLKFRKPNSGNRKSCEQWLGLNRPRATRHRPGPVVKMPGLAMPAGVAHARSGGGHRTPAIRGGAAAAGSLATGPQRGLHEEHGGGSGVAPGKVAEGWAHPRRSSTVRWWEGASAAMLDNGDRAPMAGDDRRRALEHWERKGSKMRGRIEDREG
jgi:hypothetical protein